MDGACESSSVLKFNSYFMHRLMNDRVVGVGDCHELVGQAKVQMALVQVSVPVVAGVVPG